MADFKVTVCKLFKSVDIEVNGSRPFDIQVHNKLFYSRVLSKKSLGLGESYMDGWWDCEALDQFSYQMLRGRIDKQVKPTSPSFFIPYIRAYFLNSQSKKRAYIVGKEHYDTGNDLFSLMLDQRMIYSCGYWKNAKNLDQAQINKLDLVCRKLHLKPGMKVLEIGCGWGGFAKYAAENYGVSVHGITVSKEQMDYAKKSCEGLEITFELKREQIFSREIFFSKIFFYADFRFTATHLNAQYVGSSNLIPNPVNFFTFPILPVCRYENKTQYLVPGIRL